MNPDSALFAALSMAGGVVTVAGGVVVWVKLAPEIRKLRSEARKTDVDAAVAEDRAEDEHWAAIVRAQTEAVVQPLRQEVDGLRAEVSSLRTEVELVRTRYWRAINHVRALLSWIHRHHPDPTGLPSAPVEIANDI